MSNAIKFTPKNGTIKIALDIQEELPEDLDIDILRRGSLTIISKQSKNLNQSFHKLRFSEDNIDSQNARIKHKVKLIIKIIDSGRGIAKENMEKLFIKFNRLEEHEDINK